MSFVARLRRLGTPAGLLFIGKIAMTGSQGLILVILGRLLGAEAVGTYTLALALVSPVFLLAHMRTQDVIGVDKRAAERWTEHFVAVVIVGALAAGICVIGGFAFAKKDLGAVVAGLTVVKGVQSLVFTCHGLWLGEGKFSAVTKSNLIRSVALLVALAAGSLYGGLVAGVAAMAIASVLILLGLEIRATPSLLMRQVSVRSQLILIRTLLPLGMVAFVISANQAVVRFMVEGSAGVAALGVFAATAYLVRLGSVAAQSVGASLSPQLRRARLSHDAADFLRISKRAALSGAGVGLLLLLLGSLFGPRFITLIYGPEFQPSRQLVALVFIAGIPLFASTALAVPAVAVGNNRRLLGAAVGGFVATCLAAVVLIPSFGLSGGALAWAFGETAGLLGLIWHVSRGRHSLDSFPAAGALASEGEFTKFEK